MRIAVIGNSHVAALKHGLSGLDDALRQSLALTFFASRQDGMKHLRVRERRLVAAKEPVHRDLAHTSGGSGEIAVEQFDAFLLHGLALRFPYALFDGVYRTEKFRAAFVAQVIRESIALRIHDQLRQITDKPILVVPNPLISHADSQSRADVARSAAVNLSYREFIELTQVTLKGRSRATGQPPETISEGLWTHPAFWEGARKIDLSDRYADKEQPEADYLHMNARFGVELWHHALTELNALLAARSPQRGNESLGLTTSG